LAIVLSKDKDRQDNGQKIKTEKTMAKRKRKTRQWPQDKDRQDNGQKIKHCLVCLFLLAIVLSVFIFWPLSCLFLSFGHCLVCLYLLAIVLSVFIFWPDKDRQDSGQKIKTDNTMAKR
jgi:protein-S-isoprenylcysteine O-methyltransferase Ste14